MMDEKYEKLLKQRLDEARQAADQMSDVDKAYLAGRLTGILESQGQPAAPQTTPGA